MEVCQYCSMTFKDFSSLSTHMERVHFSEDIEEQQGSNSQQIHEWSCPSCTLENPPTATECEVCETPFHHSFQQSPNAPPSPSSRNQPEGNNNNNNNNNNYSLNSNPPSNPTSNPTSNPNSNPTSNPTSNPNSNPTSNSPKNTTTYSTTNKLEDIVTVKSEMLECPICFELFEGAVETSCGHAFCTWCITRCLESESVCPVCKGEPSPIHPSFVLRAIIGEIKKGCKDNAVLHSPDELREKGNEHFKQGKYAEAIKFYTRAVDINDSSVAFSNRAMCYIKLGQYVLGLFDAEKAVTLDRSNTKAYLRAAICSRSLRRFDKAKELLKKARESDKKSEFVTSIEYEEKELSAEMIGPRANIPPQPANTTPNGSSSSTNPNRHTSYAFPPHSSMPRTHVHTAYQSSSTATSHHSSTVPDQQNLNPNPNHPNYPNYSYSRSQYQYQHQPQNQNSFYYQPQPQHSQQSQQSQQSQHAQRPQSQNHPPSSPPYFQSSPNTSQNPHTPPLHTYTGQAPHPAMPPQRGRFRSQRGSQPAPAERQSASLGERVGSFFGFKKN